VSPKADLDLANDHNSNSELHLEALCILKGVDFLSLYIGADKPDQGGNKLHRQKILMFIYHIYYHNWRNISTVYIYNKTSMKRNILTINQNTSGSRSG
jgi:hypothetical protein